MPTATCNCVCAAGGMKVLASWHDTSDDLIKHLVAALVSACLESNENRVSTIPDLVWEASGDDEWRVIALEVLGHICVEPGAYSYPDYGTYAGRGGYCKLLERYGTPAMDLSW